MSFLGESWKTKDFQKNCEFTPNQYKAFLSSNQVLYRDACAFLL
ncbi:hypothetical protein IGK06_002453 [Enterococcus sp. AZ142]|jgi:hypothetical protein|nr:hypothetical protein A5852_002582 [Enterococcus faecium]